MYQNKWKTTVSGPTMFMEVHEFMRFRREQIMTSVESRKVYIPLFSENIVENKITLAIIVLYYYRNQAPDSASLGTNWKRSYWYLR